MAMGRRLCHPWDDRCPKIQRFYPTPNLLQTVLRYVFDDEVANLAKKYGGNEEAARKMIDDDHQDALKTGRNPIVRFYIPSSSTVGRHFATIPQIATWESLSLKRCA